ncbi:nitrogen regulation protein NR(II) [Cohnella sp. AR92]|uniref:two-component system sensor histidine kinase NtrB n=1 Tax=Cohnella sp. AR92 TaxID=648716 RepID=UPI000F8D2216|nr:ATP-binding protein [Cohnella sp. AR92]RUS45467.1 PAS domain S-box protein [Cohnella sp. AR92]
MYRWETRYFATLVAFVMGNEEANDRKMAELQTWLQNTSTEDMLKYHEDSVRMLLSNAEDEDRMSIMHRSLLFLMEVISALKQSEGAATVEDRDSDRLKEAVIDSIPIEHGPPSKFETVLQHMDTGVALFGSDGHLRFLNVQMARLLQMPRRSLIGQSFRQLLYHPALRRSLRLIFLRMYKEFAYYRRYHREFEDENGRIMLISVSRIEELEGDYLVSVKDVSEYKQIEQTAFQNDKLAMLGKIAASIAHEIRNPLTSIRGFIQLLKPYLESIGKQEYVRIILSEIDRANEIIYEFLNSSKPSAPMKKKLTVAELLKETNLLTQSEAHMKGCEMQTEIFDEEIMIAIDVKQIKQVLLNMVKNAIDAIQAAGDNRKGLIELSSRKEGRYAVIRIRDNGKGMDRSTLSRLFDPFFTTKEEGTGLGLSVSYRIIRNHGGMIEVKSTPGEGTEFIIYLPLAEERE